MLNLMQGAEQCEVSEHRTQTGFEPPMFAAGPFLGNIGGPICTFPDDMDDEYFDGDEAKNARNESDGADVLPIVVRAKEVIVAPASGARSDRETILSA